MVLNMRQYPPLPLIHQKDLKIFLVVTTGRYAQLIQLLSCVWLFATPWTAICQASLSIVFFFFFFFFFYIELHELFPWFGDNFLTIFNSRRWLKLMPSESVMPSIKPTHPLSPPSSRLSIFPSIRVFCNKSVLCITWPKYWSFSISPSNEYSGFISFRIDWFDLLAVQGRDSHDSSLASQFESINSSTLSLLYGPTLKSICDYQKNHSFYYMDLCWQNDVSAFQYTV